MTQEEKQKQYSPKRWTLYENDDLVATYESHSAAKKAKYFRQKSANEDMLDITYTIKPYE